MAPFTRTDLRPTRVAVNSSVGGGPPVVHLRTGLLAPRVVRRGAPSPATVHVALVATTAGLLGGDALELDVEVGPGLRLDLTEAAGTVAYHGRGRSVLVRARLRIAAGATLVWAGEPLVVADGADVERVLVADVAHGGRLLLRDHVALGRAGERGGSLLCRTELSYAGRPGLVESLDLRATPARDAPGMLGAARVIDTVTAIGWRPVDGSGARPGGLDRPGGPPVYALSVPGAQARAMLRASHESPLPRLWEEWAATLAVRNAG